MFTTLSTLTSLVKKEEPVQVVEAKSAASDFDGIRSVVEDSLADLHDKVEALMELAKSTGAMKLDTVKDKDGMTVFKKIKKLADDAQQIKKLMTEAEAMVMQVAEGQVDEGDALLEGKNYDDSAEFTEEFYGVVQKVNDIKRVVKAPRFMGWMKSTDHNFGPLGGEDEDDMDADAAGTPPTSCESVAREVIEDVDSLAEHLGVLEKMLHNAT